MDTYCFCADCIRCGCGTWEKHHGPEKIEDLERRQMTERRRGEDAD
jgi:hypothetical protein